jgi:hypothetical protein
VGDQLFVVGFHRSGTSLVCQLLRQAGVFFGYGLLGAFFSNLYGRFEVTKILAKAAIEPLGTGINDYRVKGND